MAWKFNASMEFRWPAGWPELPFTSQLQQGSLEVTSCLPGRPKLRAVVRIFVHTFFTKLQLGKKEKKMEIDFR